MDGGIDQIAYRAARAAMETELAMLVPMSHDANLTEAAYRLSRLEVVWQDSSDGERRDLARDLVVMIPLQSIVREPVAFILTPPGSDRQPVCAQAVLNTSTRCICPAPHAAALDRPLSPYLCSPVTNGSTMGASASGSRSWV